MNLPNKLTVFRILLIPFILFFILFDPKALGVGRLTREGILAALRFGAEALRADVAYPVAEHAS